MTARWNSSRQAGLLVALISIAIFAAPVPAEAPPQNLAAGAKYECAPPPNYWGWKNPQHGDHGQLTDGQILETWNTEAGLFYSVPSSMGWSVRPPMVVFDLGETRTITGIGLHTVLSPYGPWWPKAITVLVSDDNEHFYLTGPELTAAHDQLEPPLTDELVRQAIDRVMRQEPPTLWNRYDGLNATGRYVALFMTKPADTGTIVVDEIEIYGHTEATPVSERPDQAFTEGTGGVLSYKLFGAISERLSRDIESLRQKITAASTRSSAHRRLLQDLDALDAKRLAMPVRPTAGFRAVLPINALHQQIFELQAALWRAQDAPALRLWQTHRWDPLTPLEEPQGDHPRLEFVMAQNSVRSDVLNLTDALDRPCTVNLTLKGLPAKHLDIFEVPLVDTKPLEPVAAALVPVKPNDGVYTIQVASGMTRQVWVRCSSKALDAGQYDGQIRITTGVDQQQAADVPVVIEVPPVVLPDRLSLYLGGWDYASPGVYQVTEGNIDAYVAMLQEYGLNVTWRSGSMGLGTYDADGNLVGKPSRGEVDEWLAYWPDATMYCCVAGALYTHLLDTPHGEKKIRLWAKDWATYLQSHGVAPEKVAILIRDEPGAAELDGILRVGRAVKRGAPKFKIFNDIHFPDPTKAPPVIDDVMREACDIQCFNVGHYVAHPQANAAFMIKHEREGLEWWCYNTGERLADPYVAWLLRPWFCFANGLSGAHWWAFGDGHLGFSWNEYVNPGPSRTPLYLAKDSVTSGKGLEAMREGAQDYELLTMLSDQLAKWKQTDPAAAAARRILEEDVARVLAVHTNEQKPWKIPKDRSVADEVRIKVLRKLADMPDGK